MDQGIKGGSEGRKRGSAEAAKRKGVATPAVVILKKNVCKS
jgi:hypothetical protein